METTRFIAKMAKQPDVVFDVMEITTAGTTVTKNLLYAQQIRKSNQIQSQTG